MSKIRLIGFYAWAVDYFPCRRWRRWEVRTITKRDNEKARVWRRFTYRGAERTKARLERRSDAAIRNLA